MSKSRRRFVLPRKHINFDLPTSVTSDVARFVQPFQVADHCLLSYSQTPDDFHVTWSIFVLHEIRMTEQDDFLFYFRYNNHPQELMLYSPFCSIFATRSAKFFCAAHLFIRSLHRYTLPLSRYPPRQKRGKWEGNNKQQIFHVITSFSEYPIWIQAIKQMDTHHE